MAAYTTTQQSKPTNKLFGIVCCGSFISPATNVMLFHPSYAQNAPDMAATIAATNAQPVGSAMEFVKKFETLPFPKEKIPMIKRMMAPVFTAVNNTCNAPLDRVLL